MRSMLRVYSTLVDWFALCSAPLFARIVLRRMMNIFFRGVRRRDNTDRAP